MSLCKEFVALALANGLNTSALCRLERFLLGPTHNIHRSQGAKCVTYVPSLYRGEGRGEGILAYPVLFTSKTYT